MTVLPATETVPPMQLQEQGTVIVSERTFPQATEALLAKARTNSPATGADPAIIRTLPPATGVVPPTERMLHQ
jgi:hypothetical protein